MTLNFFTIITIISVFLTMILSLFFFVTKKGFSNENKILAILLVIFNLQIIYSFLTSAFTYQYFLDWHKSVFLIRQTSFLIGPLIYFYVNSFLKRQDIIHFRSLFHFLPFISVLSFLIIFYRYNNHFIIWESKLGLYDTIIILTVNFIYIIISVLSMKSMNINFRGFYKSIRISSHNIWLQFLLLGFIVIWIINLNSFAIYMIIKRPWWCAYTASIYCLVAFLFINAIMFILLLKPDIYYKITKYKNNKLKENDKNEYLQKLNSIMETNKPFLNPEISLESLANEISVSPRILSQIINETYNKNFKCYILEFRVKESMRMLEDKKYKKHTVLEILYKVGFNSKSTFNNQFKLYTNLTPQEYRSKFVN
jgi:AraC-like DNA-binding protein